MLQRKLWYIRRGYTGTVALQSVRDHLWFLLPLGSDGLSLPQRAELQGNAGLCGPFRDELKLRVSHVVDRPAEEIHCDQGEFLASCVTKAAVTFYGHERS